MTYEEFSQLTESTIRGMYDRLADTARDDFEGLFHGGELSFAIDTLLGGLVRLRVPITPTERGNLVRLLEDLGEPASRLDAITVIDETNQPPA